MKNYITIILTLLVSTATAQEQKLPGNLYYLGDDLETASVADRQTALVELKEQNVLIEQTGTPTARRWNVSSRSQSQSAIQVTARTGR